jgi:NTE family protein
LQIGAHYDDLFKAGVLLNWTDRQILFGNDFLSADVVIGENFRYNIQYLRDNGAHLSIGLQSVLQKFDLETEFAEAFSTFDPTMNYTRMQYLNLSNRLNFQYVYRDNFAWGFGGEHQYLKTENTNPQAIIETYENAHFHPFIILISNLTLITTACFPKAVSTWIYPENGI